MITIGNSLSNLFFFLLVVGLIFGFFYLYFGFDLVYI